MADTNTISVVIIEDEAAYAKLLQLALGRSDTATFTVRAAGTLADGLRRVAAEVPDVVLLDLDLPDSHGLSTLKSFLAAAPGIPVVILSSVGDEATVYESRRIGAQEYLVKGPETMHLVERVLGYTQQRFRAQRDLKASEEMLKTILDAIPTGVLLIDFDTHQIVDANAAAALMIGLPREQVVGRTCREFIEHAGHEECIVTVSGQTLDSRETLVTTASGRKVPVLKNAVLVAIGGRRLVLESFVDITARKRLEEQLHSESMRDTLTGLYNRRGLTDLAEQTLRLARRNRWRVYVMFADLDGMKRINDSLGHRAGDEALQRVADALRRTFRESDIVARMGGDEFCVMGGVIDDVDEARITARIRENLAIVRRAEDGFDLNLSIGFAYFSPHAPTTLEDLLAQADERMYACKRNRASRADA